MWSSIGATFENNQAVANIVKKLDQQVKVNAGNVGTAMAKANQAIADAAALKTQLVGMYQTQRSEEEKLTQVNRQLYQLNMILNQFWQEFWQHKLTPPILSGAGIPGIGPVMVNGVPVEDAVVQLKLQIQVFQSRLISDSASIAGHFFGYYEDTLAWVVAHCSPKEWQYVMDMPALYSLIRPDGKHHDFMLHASTAQARLSLIHNVHLYCDTAIYYDWYSIYKCKKTVRKYIPDQGPYYIHTKGK
jgi:hypothetical protein